MAIAEPIVMKAYTEERKRKRKGKPNESNGDAASSARTSDSVPAGSPAVDTATGNRSRQSDVTSWNGISGILTITVAIAVLAIIDKTWSDGVLLGLLLYMVLGAAFPMVFVPLGIVIVTYLVFVGGGTKISNWVHSMLRNT